MAQLFSAHLDQLIKQMEASIGQPIGQPQAGQPEPAQPPDAAQPPEAPSEIAGEGIGGTQAEPAPFSVAGRLAAIRASKNR